MLNVRIDITPDTKVGELLDAYPALEGKLLELSPTFAKLRNPILRKTIGKVATLRQAAQVGGVQLGTLINSLRQAAGIDEQVALELSTSRDARPSWLVPDRIVNTFDARPLLESGQHPIGIVMEHLRDLRQGDVYELVTPFVPAPLLDMAREKGFQAWTDSDDPSCVKSYLAKV